MSCVVKIQELSALIWSKIIDAGLRRRKSYCNKIGQFILTGQKLSWKQIMKNSAKTTNQKNSVKANYENIVEVIMKNCKKVESKTTNQKNIMELKYEKL